MEAAPRKQRTNEPLPLPLKRSSFSSGSPQSNVIRFATLLGTISSAEERTASDDRMCEEAGKDGDEDNSSCSSSSSAEIDDLLDSLPTVDARGDTLNISTSTSLTKKSERTSYDTNPTPIEETAESSNCHGHVDTWIERKHLMDHCNREKDASDYYTSCSRALRNMLVDNTSLDEGTECSFPSLSLETDDQEHHQYSDVHNEENNKHHTGSRKQLWEAAAAHLSRPIIVSPKMYDEDIADVPGQLLCNISNSFSSLIDARLRAYGMILLRHSLALKEQCPNKEEASRKLLDLLRIEENTAIDAIVTAFHARFPDDDRVEVSKKVCTGLNESKKAEKVFNRVIEMPLLFETVMDVRIPYANVAGAPGTSRFPKEDQQEATKGIGSTAGPNNHTRTNPVIVTVTIRAPGSITGTFSNVCPRNESSSLFMKGVKVVVDTQTLLDSMIDQARRVALQAVNNLNEFTLSSPLYDCPINAHERRWVQSADKERNSYKVVDEGSSTEEEDCDVVDGTQRNIRGPKKRRKLCKYDDDHVTGEKLMLLMPPPKSRASPGTRTQSRSHAALPVH